MSISRIDVIGAGAWGTALAALACENGLETRIWAHEEEVARAINTQNENTRFLAGIPLPTGIAASADLTTMGAADAVLLVTPAQHLRAISASVAPHLIPGTPVVICSKGIEQKTGALMSEVAAETLPTAPLAVLSGPTLAGEVARGLPAAVTIATDEVDLGEALVAALGCARFRPYAAGDVIGAEVGGAVKNVVAIACGIVAGLGFGQNARAAMITRGLAEMSRLAVAKGAEGATLAGLSGLGDLVLTATSEDSRNYSLGLEVGRGAAASDIMEERHTVAEGAYTAGAVTRLAAMLGIEMPIAEAVDRIINEGAEVKAVAAEILNRPFRRES
jgi:glycerol-3-phosphate dehydrogenase (NAD(P)+)